MSDIVIVCASLNDSTKHIVNAEFLANMKKSAFLINTSRGGLVDQEALVEALTINTIRGLFCKNILNTNISSKVPGWM